MGSMPYRRRNETLPLGSSQRSFLGSNSRSGPGIDRLRQPVYLGIREDKNASEVVLALHTLICYGHFMRNVDATRGADTKWTSVPRRTKMIVWGFVAIGIVLRLRQFLFDRSLWVDESMLALNIINRSPAELLKPLDNNQGAPLGFLLLEKLVTLFFGSSEMALRLLPFVCGIVSIFLFKAVSSRFLMPSAVPIAVALFAMLDPLIYYSAEVKQYSCDVAIALLLYSIADPLLEAPLRFTRVVVFSVIAAIAIWFSHPAVFVLAGLGISFLWVTIRNSDRRSLFLLFIPGVLLLGNFLAFYLVSLRSLSANTALLDYWQDGFAPISPSFFKWFAVSFFGLISYPVGLDMIGIAAVAIALGSCTLFSEYRARLLLLLTPIAFTLLASVFHRYPFRGRLLLFMVPSVILLIAAGLGTIRTKIRESLPLLSALMIGFLFFHPAASAAWHFFHPRTVEEIKPVIEYVGNHRLKGDTLYLYYASALPFEYYKERHFIEPMDVIVGIKSREDWKLYREDLDKLRGKGRVWILFSHVYSLFDEERLFLDYLDGIGKRLDGARVTGASVYLFDLGVTPRS
jgi:hypothetical protein